MPAKRRSGVLLGLGLGLALATEACTSSPGPATSTTTTSPAPSSTTSPAPSSTTSPSASPPVGTAVAGGFEPGSVTFVSTTTGFVIGVDSSCAVSACVALARTSDSGSSWVALPAPPAAYVAHGQSGSSKVPVVSEVRFADELDGWIYGPSLFATHDGGATWQQVDLGGSVVSLETSGGFVDAVVSPCSGGTACTGPMVLYQAPSTGGAFTKVLTGPSVGTESTEAQDLSLHAPVGFVKMSGVDQVSASIYATSSLAGGAGSWKGFPDPCAAVTNPGLLVNFVAPDTTALWSLCAGTAAAGSEEKTVVKTVNGVSTLAGTAPFSGDGEALAATASGTLVVAAASGASELYRSADGGAAWTTAESYSDGGAGFNDLGFTTDTQGVVIHGLPGPPVDFASQLLMTFDGGVDWSVVPIS